MADLTAVEQVLTEKIRPHLAAHGGDIRSLSLEDGVYRFEFLGQCSGCPSAELTTEEVVSEALKERFPDIREVVLVQSVSPALLEQARAILGRRDG